MVSALDLPTFVARWQGITFFPVPTLVATATPMVTATTMAAEQVYLKQ